MLNLGPRLSEQGYSSDDRRLLDTPRRVRRAGDAGRPAGAAAARSRPATWSASSRSCGSRSSIQQQFLPSEPAGPAGLARRRVLPAGPHDRRRLLRLRRAARRPGDVHRRRRHRQGRAGRAGDGEHARAAARGRPRMSSPGAVLARVNDLLMRRHPGAHVRHLPGASSSTRRPARWSSPTPGTTCPTSGPAGDGRASCRPPGCRSASCRACAYDEIDRRCCDPARACCCTATVSPRRTTAAREMFGFDRAGASWSPRSSGGEPDRHAARRAGRVHRRAASSRRTTSRSSPSSARTASRRADRSGAA